MDRHPRGLCVIINIENFNNKEYNREGSQVDELKLKNLFETLCFTVCVLKDLPRDKMQEAAADFASKDHSQFDAFVFVVMSHGGERDVISCADERTVSVEDLMSEFKWSKCPTLKDKPKLFFIQACRGTTETETFLCTTTDPCVDRFSTDSKLPRSVCPEEADFLLAFSTVPGYVSFRDKENGTLFVQTLVEVIRKRHCQDHLLDMLTEVNRLVAERGQAVQVPAPVHTLRRKLYL